MATAKGTSAAMAVSNVRFWYTRSNSYRYWASYLGRSDLVAAIFGENLTVDGLADNEVCIGDRFRIGGTVVEVSQPRDTCYRVGIRLNNPGIAALLVAHRRPGFYLRVIQEGLRFRIRAKSGHKLRRRRRWVASGKVPLSGRRRLFPIPLKIRTSLTAIGGAISGHPTELWAAGLKPGLWRSLGQRSKLLLQMSFSHRDARVTTFYTYPEPRPSSVTARTGGLETPLATIHAARDGRRTPPPASRRSVEASK